MQANTRFLIAVGVLGALMTGPFMLTAGLIWFNAEGAERDALLGTIVPYLPLGAAMTTFGFALGIWILRLLFSQYVRGLHRIGEQLRLMLEANRNFRIKPKGPPEVREVIGAANDLAQQRDALLDDVDAQIATAKGRVEEEKNRLAALMSELTQSVIVCNLDGRVLLYNNRARRVLAALSDAPNVAGGGELVGIGRSIFGIFERNLIDHALDGLRVRLARRSTSPVANFVTAHGRGQLLRVQMAPVLGTGPMDESGVSAVRPLTGFVLLFDNITDSFEAEAQRNQMLHMLTEGNRASMANLRAAAEMLDFPDLQEPMRVRFRKVIQEEVQLMSTRLDSAANEFADVLKSRWPLEEMLATDLLEVASGRIDETLKLPARIEAVDEGLWIRVDSFSLLEAITYLASRLRDEFEVREIKLRLTQANQIAHLDLIWSGAAMSTETVMNWELEPIRIGERTSPMTVRDVVDRHGGEMWLEREKVKHRAYLRLLLPVARPQIESETAPVGDAGLGCYDFDLFSWGEQAKAMEDCKLTELAYTVFDTETTGLRPSEGDEIIQIGALRVVNGKLRSAESFEQLIDPQRSVPEASVAIHGIQPESLVGKPTIDKVLPAFHAFARDTVLVAHNAAFDMRFLQIKERSTSLRWDHPVLDTLLLSAVVHPNQDSHSLEAIVDRLGLTVEGRHTALADAVVTAEVFLKLIPLLAEKQIFTLREAREASAKTYYARITY